MTGGRQDAEHLDVSHTQYSAADVFVDVAPNDHRLHDTHSRWFRLVELVQHCAPFESTWLCFSCFARQCFATLALCATQEDPHPAALVPMDTGPPV